MRVLHAMECTIGGTRRHLVDLALGQLQAGMEVDVVAAVVRDPGMAGDLERLRQAGAWVQQLDMVRSIQPATDWKHYRALKTILSERQPDIVHSHSSKAGVLARKASRKLSIGRRVHTPHTMAFLFSSLFSKPKRSLFRRIETSLARSTDALIAVSASEGRTLREAAVIDPEKVHVVPNGLDPGPFDTAEPLPLESFGLDPARPTLILVGLVYEAKGHDIAIEALADPAFADWQLLCVGPGDATGYGAQAAALGLGGRVVFTGPRDDVPRLLKSATALVLPSRWEGMPYVVLEAFAAGLPVIAHPVDGARDVIRDGETGILCEGIGPGPLRAGLQRFAGLSPGERDALTQHARKAVLSQHTISAMVEGTGAVYARLL